MELYTPVHGMNSVQVVMTYATDYQYRLRCLPGFLNKKYLNKYVLDGFHMPSYQTNEIYIKHQPIALDASGDPGTKDQLYALFQIYGIEETFDYLSGIATTSADTFLVHQNLYRKIASTNALSTAVEKNINDLIKDCFSQHANRTIPEIVTGTTYALLKGVPVIIKKK